MTPRPDKLLWKHLKKDVVCLRKFINIANACIELSHWPYHFKVSTSIIIPKPNKESYNSPKTFQPIILLNTISKLIKKVISERLQFQLISNDFIYQCQLEGLKQHFTTDTNVILTYFIHTSQVKNLSTSMLAFDIAQFFPLLNHQLLLILIKAGFDSKILFFFQDYLVGRKTKYLWNNFSFPSFNVDIGVGQWFALSPVLSAWYLSLLLYIFEKQLKNLKILVSILPFIDNGLFIA